MKMLPLIPALLLLAACAGKQPMNLGWQKNSLLACPASPNCVSSFAAPEDDRHYIEPIRFTRAANIRTSLLEAISTETNAQVIRADQNYIYAHYQSTLMGFIDDVEFYIDRSAQLIHLRSASRVGYGDWGVNRKRIEAIRQRLAK